MERERGITIQSAAITFQWPPKSLCPPGIEPQTINLIDTPGHQDFRYEVDRCMPILDGAVCILDGVKGVETHTERVWSSAHLSRIPRLLFVNKLDRDGASFRRSVQEVATRLKTWPLLCQIPWWNKDDLWGVIDVIHQHGLRFNTTNGSMNVVSKDSIARDNPALKDEMETARLRLIEALSEHDDQIMEDFLEHEGNVPSSSIKRAIRRLIMDGRARFTPVFAGASLRNIGVQPLLDAIVDYLPSPLDRPPLELTMGMKATTLTQVLEQRIKRKGTHHSEAPIAAIAHVFKVVNDPRHGMMSWLRVYHGTFNRSSNMWNSNTHMFEKPQHILHVSAKDHHSIAHLSTGHIGAMTNLKSARTGDTLITFPGHHGGGNHAPEPFGNLRIKAPDTPPAVAFISIEPYTRTASEKLEEALSKLEREDPSIRWSKNEKTGQLILSGMGELHLEIAQDRLWNHYKIDRDSAVWGDIEVEYSECLLAPTGPHRALYDRTIRDKQGRAGCTVSLEPLEADPGHEHQGALLESAVEREGNILHVSIPLPEDSTTLPFDPDLVRQQLINGAIAGLARGPRRNAPVRRCRVHITFDPATDYFGESVSTGGHITNAALAAVKAALKAAHENKTVGILEPFTRVQIHCPEEAGNAIQHDLVAARGGQVEEVRRPEDMDRSQVIQPFNTPSKGSSGEDGEQGVEEEEEEEEEEEFKVDPSKVYVPPDPYESVDSLRGPKKAVVRMLTIIGKAPLKEMMKYDGHLRSLTGGRHTLVLDPAGFELVVGPRERALEEGR